MLILFHNAVWDHFYATPTSKEQSSRSGEHAFTAKSFNVRFSVQVADAGCPFMFSIVLLAGVTPGSGLFAYLVAQTTFTHLCRSRCRKRGPLKPRLSLGRLIAYGDLFRVDLKRY